jgi:hypothetical protein
VTRSQCCDADTYGERGKLLCSWCGQIIEGCCEGRAPVPVTATLKQDERPPAGGIFRAGAELDVVREFETKTEDGFETCVALADKHGRVVLPWVGKGDVVLHGNERNDLKARFAAAVDALPDKALPFAEILGEALEMHARKSKDYGSDEDPYANVRASEDCGVPAWKGALIRACDKVARLKKFAREGSLANESAEDSLIDLCVYFPIALMLYRESSKQMANG